MKCNTNGNLQTLAYLIYALVVTALAIVFLHTQYGYIFSNPDEMVIESSTEIYTALNFTGML